nr:MAG TPA: hypothetical protein [Caudoviricetes sp.]
MACGVRKHLVAALLGTRRGRGVNFKSPRGLLHHPYYKNRATGFIRGV